MKDEKDGRNEILEIWRRLREMASRQPPPDPSLTEEDVIEAIRKTREQIWKKKLARRT